MKQLGLNHVIISQSAGAPSPHGERAVGIIRRLINQKLSANAPPRKGSQRWWPLARTLVRSYNDTPMTDSRAPKTPNQLRRMKGSAASKVVSGMQTSGAKRLGLRKNSRKGPGGAKVQKSLPVLEVGDRVRAAIENLRGKQDMEFRKYPQQRWSSKIYVVATVKPRKLGFARYILRGMPRQRWEREDLLLVRKLKSRNAGKEESPSGDNEIEPAVAKQSSKLHVRHDRES